MYSNGGMCDTCVYMVSNPPPVPPPPPPPLFPAAACLAFSFSSLRLPSRIFSLLVSLSNNYKE